MITEPRTACAVCGDDDLLDFLDLGASPLANKLPRTIGEREVFIPLRLSVCNRCWLVQQEYVPPAAQVFDHDYSFYSGTSPALVEYHKVRAQELLTLYPDQAKRLTLEVACNDGDLLRHFAAAGCRTLGVDPADGPASEALHRGLDVLRRPFHTGTARDITEEYGPVGLLVANHVVAHVEDLVDFLRGVRLVLADDGVASFEFQYLGDLLLGNQIDHVYHEHRYFLSLTALKNAARRAGLVVVDVRRVRPQGGSLQTTLVREASPIAVDDAVTRLWSREQWLRTEDTYAGTQGRADYMRVRLLDELDAACLRGTVAGYGMPAKATTLLNFCQIGTETLTHIVDTTPHKIGRLSPGTKVPVVGSGQRPDPDTYLLLVWNYIDSVINREIDFITGGGRFIIPIPVPETTNAVNN